jgi:hypothetical protein
MMVPLFVILMHEVYLLLLGNIDDVFPLTVGAHQGPNEAMCINNEQVTDRGFQWEKQQFGGVMYHICRMLSSEFGICRVINLHEEAQGSNLDMRPVPPAAAAAYWQALDQWATARASPQPQSFPAQALRRALHFETLPPAPAEPVLPPTAAEIRREGLAMCVLGPAYRPPVRGLLSMYAFCDPPFSALRLR